MRITVKSLHQLLSIISSSFIKAASVYKLATGACQLIDSLIHSEILFFDYFVYERMSALKIKLGRNLIKKQKLKAV